MLNKDQRDKLITLVRNRVESCRCAHIEDGLSDLCVEATYRAEMPTDICAQVSLKKFRLLCKLEWERQTTTPV